MDVARDDGKIEWEDVRRSVEGEDEGQQVKELDADKSQPRDMTFVTLLRGSELPPKTRVGLKRSNVGNKQERGWAIDWIKS